MSVTATPAAAPAEPLAVQSLRRMAATLTASIAKRQALGATQTADFRAVTATEQKRLARITARITQILQQTAAASAVATAQSAEATAAAAEKAAGMTPEQIAALSAPAPAVPPAAQ